MSAVQLERTGSVGAEVRLGGLLRADAVLCGVSGLAGVALAGPVSDLLTTPRPGAVRTVGIGLLVLALDLALVSRLRPRPLAAGALVTAAIDAVWLLATVELVVVGAFEPLGVAVAAVTGAVTAAVGVGKVALARASRAAGVD